MRLLILLFLVSCQSNRGNTVLNFKGEQASPVFVYTDETKKFIDVDQSFCLVREHEINIIRIGPVGKSWKMPLEYCDRIVAWKSYNDFIIFLEKVRLEIINEKMNPELGRQ